MEQILEQKRLSIIVPKDIADAVFDISQIHNLTTTDIVNTLLAQFVQNNSALLIQYRTFKNDAKKKYPLNFAQDLGCDSDESD